ncbi:hypothetical protein [Marinicellulosiphila megalodicopiae]|uniref:hypothetical protein n=1 Tax=Marinicellulosiphila megalodicopiae TaxID=2724896 RepID=UPI003BAFDF70
MNTVDSNELTDIENAQTLFSFSSWLSAGFWQILRHKWQLIPAALFIILTLACLIVGGAILVQTSEGDTQMAVMGCIFMLAGLLFYPVISVGFFSLFQKLEYDRSDTTHYFNSLFSGFGTAFYKLLGLGGFLVIAHCILIACLAFIFSMPDIFASQFMQQINTDMLSDEYITQRNTTMSFATFILYPLIASPFALSPLKILLQPETSIFAAMQQSIKIVFSHFLNFLFFIIFSSFIFVFFIIGVALIPAIFAGIFSLLPWENRLAVAQNLFTVPALAVFFGFGFCIAWFYSAIYHAYSEYNKNS